MPRSMSIELIVLNYQGAALLAECLPSICDAAERSTRPCAVTVIDNDSRDGSVDWLRANHPTVRVVRSPNRGLCSFNDVVAASDAQVAVLLNNDVRLAIDAIDPLVAPLFADNARFDADCFLTAPRCYRFDGQTHEGEKTAIAWRWGLVAGTAFFDGHESAASVPDWTAASGCVMAVSRERFVALGGFDPIYLPGRIEDLDLGYRGFAAGWHARYVPEAIAYHRGAASFEPAFGATGCDALALRNTLLFQWKHLRHPWHRARMATGIMARIARDTWRAPRVPAERRWPFVNVLREAMQRRRECEPTTCGKRASSRREREFFARFHPRRMANAVVEAAP
jgi:N-acetylglucosaminyl-diphospho-decaprenol L-rhamnosyltransferase